MDVLIYVSWGLGILATGWIIWEDFRIRSIPIWAMVLLFLTGILVHSADFSLNYLLEVGINVGIVLVILGVVKGYFWLRGIPGIMDVYLGWGDVALLVSLSTWLTTESFIWMYACATISALVGTGLLRFFRRNSSPEIPLAGYIGLCFLWFQLPITQSIWMG